MSSEPSRPARLTTRTSRYPLRSSSCAAMRSRPPASRSASLRRVSRVALRRASEACWAQRVGGPRRAAPSSLSPDASAGPSMISTFPDSVTRKAGRRPASARRRFSSAIAAERMSAPSSSPTSSRSRARARISSRESGLWASERISKATSESGGRRLRRRRPKASLPSPRPSLRPPLGGTTVGCRSLPRRGGPSSGVSTVSSWVKAAVSSGRPQSVSANWSGPTTATRRLRLRRARAARRCRMVCSGICPT